MVSTVTRDVLTPPCENTCSYCIRLKVSPAAREDAWDLCGVAVHYGGVEVDDCCFVFPNEESWLTALDVLRRRFGPEYFEAVDSGSGEIA